MPRAIDDGIWVTDHDDFTMPGGIELGTRSTWLRLADGSLLLHAPGDLSDAEVAAARELGPVSVIVAPNAFHHLFLERAHARFPDAAIHAVPSLQAKYPQLPMQPLSGEVQPAWKGVLEQTPVDGAPRLDEVVFFHPASRSVLLVDLCFNIQRASRLRTRLMMRLTNAWQRFGPSRLARSFFKDEAAVRASVDRILAWDFERVIVTHGDIVERDGRERLRAAFEWLG